jgi:propionyl-CoA carboxylase alpha chain
MTRTRKSISAVLVANRSEVVSRVARTASRLGIRTIGVYTESDVDGAYLADVDSAIAIGDDATSSPYLDPEAIIVAAKTSGADAIHPGYGFLAENADFAEACAQNGLTWIGPTPEAMREMGGKIRAKEIARDAGVPVLDSIRIGADLDPVRELAAKVGLPLLIKPSAGGGGKGMHRVDSLEDLEDIVAGARREALSSFGDDTLFVERYVERPRHVEVQIFGDQFGNVIHLGDRDCSIQRRHQKIIEEAPAPDLAPDVRERLAASAVALARQIGYVGAGTVEFLAFDDQIAFLEMNTRLQVEHPVTEEVTGLDLVELQLRVAAGEPLPLTQEDVRISGHSIEVRLYAEDPANNYLPSPGLVRKLEVPDAPAARWELGVRSGSRVSSRYDPMIAKIVTTGDTREDAARKLVTVLGRMRVHGVATNRGLLAAIAANEDFLAGDLTTAFLDERPGLLAPATPDGIRAFHAIAAALHSAMHVQERKIVQRFAPYGWRNLRSQDEVVTLHAGDDALEVRYHQERDGSWRVAVADVEHVVRVFGCGPDGIDLEVSGKRQTALVATYPDQVVVDTSAGESRFVERAALEEAEETAAAGACVAIVPGTVVDVRVKQGQRVAAGDTLVVLEAMKMEHRLAATGPGLVGRVLVAVGDSVDYQQVLVDVTPDAPGEAGQ